MDVLKFGKDLVKNRSVWTLRENLVKSNKVTLPILSHQMDSCT